MAASAAPVPPGTASDSAASAPRRRRIARWKPPVAFAAVVLGLVAGQAVSLGLALGFGGDEPGVVDGVGLIAADAVLIAVVGLILGVIAIVFGRQAKSEVASGRKSGKGQAQAGFVLGVIAVAAAIINMIVTVAIIAS